MRLDARMTPPPVSRAGDTGLGQNLGHREVCPLCHQLEFANLGSNFHGVSMCTRARAVKLNVCMDQRCIGALLTAKWRAMGETRPKSELDREYREMVARFLVDVWKTQGFTNQKSLAKALNLDRATVSRYLSQDTRAPLQRLQRLERSLGIKVPQDVADAYWASEDGPGEVFDVEAEIRRFHDAIKDKTPEEQRAILVGLQRAATGTHG